MIGTDVSVAASLLKEGEVVAIPTETVYGLAANALDTKAVSKIYAAKKRPSFNPLIVHVSDLASAQRYVKNFPPIALKLAEAFWPGPLSILLSKHSSIPDLVTAGLPNVVVRVPKHPITLELLKKIDFPLAAPSANISNTVSPTSAQRVNQNLGERIKYVLDGGASEVGVERAIISAQNNKIVLLREGGISQEQIESILGSKITLNTNAKISSPGQLKKHYATNKKLIVTDNLQKTLSNYNDKRCSALLYETKEVPESVTSYHLSKTYNLPEIANNLFECMHLADEDKSEIIVVEKCKEEGIGRAINDRLRRASW